MMIGTIFAIVLIKVKRKPPILNLHIMPAVSALKSLGKAIKNVNIHVLETQEKLPKNQHLLYIKKIHHGSFELLSS